MDLSKIRLVCQLKSNVTKLKKDSWISMFTSNIKQDKHCFFLHLKFLKFKIYMSHLLNQT